MNKTFKFTHLIFGTTALYSEQNMPEWLRHKDYSWFLNEHVLTLSVGGSIETDFHKITRVA